jgi:hypothetical protein
MNQLLPQQPIGSVKKACFRRMGNGDGRTEVEPWKPRCDGVLGNMPCKGCYSHLNYAISTGFSEL